MTIFEAIERRISTRSFDGKAFDEAVTAALQGATKEAATISPPFGHRVRLAMYAGDSNGARVRLGTYGLISGASAFLVAAVARDPGGMEDLGYIVEKFVLEATKLDISSCWIGGVFDRSKSGAILGVSGQEIVPAVIALGRPAAKRSLPDRIITNSAKSRSRRPLDAVAISDSGSLTTLEPSILRVLEATRWAPSASNKQPWRLIGSRSGKSWLLCLDEDRVYNNSLGDAHIQNIDMGIAMLHFEESARALSLPGSWRPASFNPAGAEKSIAEARARNWIPIAFWEI